MDHLEIAKLLDTRRFSIVEQVTDETMHHPFWNERFGEVVREKIAFDNDHSLLSLIKAIRYRSPMILDDYVVWLRKTLVKLRCSSGQVRESFSHIWSVVAAHMPAETHPVIHDYIVSALQALAYPNASAQRIAASHNELADALLSETFDHNWHWQAAYNEEGRERAAYDAWYCVDYVIDALGMSDGEVLARHLRWMRDRNIKRGLSTIHMQQMIWLLAEAGERLLPPAVANDLRRVLEAGAAHLVYDRENCRALMAVQDQIVGEVAGQLVYAGLAPQADHAAMEIGWYLAYINDGLATSDPTGLVSYTRWMQYWFASQGMPDTPLRQSYAALGDALERHLPQYAAHDARAILHAAQSLL